MENLTAGQMNKSCLAFLKRTLMEPVFNQQTFASGPSNMVWVSLDPSPRLFVPTLPAVVL